MRKQMTVRELINRLLDFDMEENVVINLDGGEKIAQIDSVEDWHRQPEIHFTDWRENYKPEDCPLKEVPSGKWIPVNEELPITEDEVLVTYIVNGNRKKRYVETAYYYPTIDEWNSINGEYRIPNTKVEIIAWMPLPEPYKADRSVKK